MRNAFWDVLLLVALASVNTFLISGVMPLRGEETRRGQAAKEMRETGNWVVPQQQRQTYLTKPPLMYWCIVATAEVRGAFDRYSVRAPSAIATILTILLIYLYGRGVGNRLTGFAAAFAFATMAYVLDSGADGEIDPLFVLFIAASMLIWHLGYTRKWNPATVWSIGYACAGLAMITKSIQGPVYFAGGACFFLMIKRDWRMLFHWGHAVGIVAFFATISLWLLPLAQMMGWDHVAHVFWGAEVGPRITPTAERMLRTIGHIFQYPAEHFLLLTPWSLFLLAYFSKTFRQRLQEHKSVALFCAACCVVAFPTCWLIPTAETRYFRPLYPCIAVLAGIVLQQILELKASKRIVDSFENTAKVFGYGAAGLAVAALIYTQLPSPLALPTPRLGWLLPFTVISLALAGAIYWATRERTKQRLMISFVATGMVASAICNLFVLDQKSLATFDPEPSILAVKKQIGDAKLVSYERLYHRFTFYYPDPIPIEDLPDETQGDLGTVQPAEYFCFHATIDSEPENLPFEWEEIAVVPMDRRKKGPEEPQNQWIVVGKRISTDESQLRVATRPDK